MPWAKCILMFAAHRVHYTLAAIVGVAVSAAADRYVCHTVDVEILMVLLLLMSNARITLKITYTYT